jgi:16S rRNA (cytosine967-C5)-methyltransferase
MNAVSNGEEARSAREVALDVLIRVERDQSYSNLLLDKALHDQALKRSDAALATELVYGTIQRLNTIDYFLEKFVHNGIRHLQPWVRCLLRLSFYQLLYLDRIPAHAAVHEAVNIAKKRGRGGGTAGLVNAVLRNALRHPERLEVPAEGPPVRRIALKHSHPEWLVARWMRQYGEETAEAICAANNLPPRGSVRANAMRTSREQLVERLRADGLDASPSPLAPSGIIVQRGGNLARTRWYREGELSIQDESSMLVAEIVAPLPGMRVLDCCAAPGGKATHMAEMMRDAGEICAVDLHAHKVKLIEEQARRLNLSCIRAIACDARQLPDRFAPQSFDRILLDAPCSGFGVIRRKPELKWRKSEADITALSALQQDLLRRVGKLLKPGGALVYSTCTIEREENESVVEAFVREHPEFVIDRTDFPQLPDPVRASLAQRGMVQILPSDYGSDGFFIARLRRRGEL